VSQIEEVESPSKDECVISMLAHVLMIFSWFWAPLVIYFAKCDSRFVAFHALQALYWQLIMFCGWMLTMVAFFVLAFSTAASAGPHNQAAMPEAFLLLFPLVWVGFAGGWLVTLILGILFGIKSSHGEWAEYPVIGRWALRSAKGRTT
jgi:uncharacterized Tic20 family protein